MTLNLEYEERLRSVVRAEGIEVSASDERELCMLIDLLAKRSSGGEPAKVEAVKSITHFLQHRNFANAEDVAKRLTDRAIKDVVPPTKMHWEVSKGKG